MSRRRRQAEKDKRQGLRAAGKFNAEVMDFIRPHIAPGIATAEIDRLIREYTLDHGHIPAPLNYQGFREAAAPA